MSGENTCPKCGRPYSKTAQAVKEANNSFIVYKKKVPPCCKRGIKPHLPEMNWGAFKQAKKRKTLIIS